MEWERKRVQQHATQSFLCSLNVLLLESIRREGKVFWESFESDRNKMGWNFKATIKLFLEKLETLSLNIKTFKKTNDYDITGKSHLLLKKTSQRTLYAGNIQFFSIPVRLIIFFCNFQFHSTYMHVCFVPSEDSWGLLFGAFLFAE